MVTDSGAGYAGIEEHLGALWAIGCLVASLLFRFTLPITIGAFFGAMNVWGAALEFGSTICSARVNIFDPWHHHICLGIK